MKKHDKLHDVTITRIILIAVAIIVPAVGGGLLFSGTSFGIIVGLILLFMTIPVYLYIEYKAGTVKGVGVKRITVSSNDPKDGEGEDGDLWIKYEK